MLRYEGVVQRMMKKRKVAVFLRLSGVLDEKMEFGQVVSDNPLFLPTTRTPPLAPLPDAQHPTNGGKQVQP